MAYYAKFTLIEGELFRFDTRIYLGNGNPDSESVCVGAVVGINPGSARPRVLNEHRELELGNDKMLPYVRNRFNAGYKRAGIPAPEGAYVQVLNVFYLCDERLGEAVARLKTFQNPPVCSAERLVFPLAWYAWGAESQQLAPLKARFLIRRDGKSFFMNRDRKTFGVGVPEPMEFAKHPRYMPAAPVEEELASYMSAFGANHSLQARRP